MVGPEGVKAHPNEKAYGKVKIGGCGIDKFRNCGDPYNVHNFVLCLLCLSLNVNLVMHSWSLSAHPTFKIRHSHMWLRQ
jgi:hypothetical protein